MSRTPRERRVATRYAIGFRAFGARATISGAAVEGINISQTGMLVRLIDPAPATPTVEVALPGLTPRPARVVWQSKELLGLQFDTPIDEKELTALLAGPQ